MQIPQVSAGVFQSFYANRQNYKENLKLTENKLQNTKKEKEAKTKKIIALASLAGAIIPVVGANLIKGRGNILVDTFKNNSSTIKDKLKSTYNMFEIESFPEILASSLGGILGAVSAGVLADKNPENKQAKYKEGVFELLNNITPTVFVAGLQAISDKTGKMKSAPAKAAIIAGSVAGGMFVANKTSNKINDTFFKNGEEKCEKRKFHLKDCLVHTDDILSLLVLAKIPLAKKIQADKILPLLYAKAGYEAGIAKKENKKCN